MATAPEIDGWYRTLDKPSWTPPDYVFGPVWTILYILMAVAAWLVCRPAGFKAAAVPLTLFGFQLLLNVAWSWIFFKLHQPGWAFFEITLLWIAILATIASALRHSKTAAWLLVPYLAWVSFAAVLNYAIWQRQIDSLASAPMHYAAEKEKGSERFSTISSDPFSFSFLSPPRATRSPCAPPDAPPPVLGPWDRSRLHFIQVDSGCL
jgi:tryptophan-rich sensory protein